MKLTQGSHQVAVCQTVQTIKLLLTSLINVTRRNFQVDHLIEMIITAAAVLKLIKWLRQSLS